MAAPMTDELVPQVVTTTSQPTTPGLAEDHEPNSTWLLILMALFVVVMVTVAVAFFRGRRPSA